ncbi:DUF3110 domain-containing protein [Nodosilinea sp. E11]|uniref:DUF3110 domain-containing protein n=1 Tax=Nodosilinea sp. E11 TaxID=3037479 RepID=UPI0029348B4F|nr:DUF3110 domain-containing protein [Nodosilinea sp. E11]WOD38427.1 DUF3110 domain-containing protein [Nodosilinea sp. E11]
MVVYVLLFNARTENEGIHTLNVDGQDVVLMFEHEDDATRFGLMLEAQDFPESTVEGMDQAEIEEFCESAGYSCRLVPQGSLAMPPEQNVEQTTWNPDDPDASLPVAPTADASDVSQAELDRLRQQFEKLL